MQRKEIISMLKRYNKIKLELEDKKRELCDAVMQKAREENSIPELSKTEYIQTNKIIDATYEAARRCIEIYDQSIEKIEREIKTINTELATIEKWLRSLDQNEYKIINEMYIKQNGKSYMQLQSIIKGYSVAGLKKIRDRALKKIEKI